MTATALLITAEGIRLFHAAKAQELHHLLLESASNAAQNMPLWLDFTATSTAEWKNILHHRGLSPQDLEICTEDRHFPHVEPLENNGLALRLPIRNNWADEFPSYLNILLLGNTILTHCEGEAAPLVKTRKRLVDGERPDGNDPIFLLLFLLEGAADAQVSDVLQVRKMVDHLGEKLKADSDNTETSEIMQIKYLINRLSGQCEEQLFCSTLLRSLLNKPAAHTGARENSTDIIDTLGHLQRSLSRLEKRMDDQLTRIEGLVRNSTDRRLQILTVVSLIFMPLTFIVGIYGMNFKYMPELDAPWGYPLVMLLMTALAAGMIFYFLRRGWFR